MLAGFSGSGANTRWEGMLRSYEPLDDATRWIKIDGVRVQLENDSPGTEVRVEALPDADLALRHLWQRAVLPDTFDDQLLETAISALVAAGAVSPDDPQLATMRAVTAALALHGRPRREAIAELPQPWCSLWRERESDGPTKTIAVGAATPLFDGVAVIVDALEASAQRWSIAIECSPEAASPYPLEAPTARMTGLVWWAEDDRGNRYLAEPSGLGGNASRNLSARGDLSVRCLGAPREIPVGHGQTRKGFVVVACLGYARAGAGALIFTKQTPDLLAGIRRCLWKLGGLAETLVWDRQAGIHAYEGRPTQEFAAFCGQLRVGWHFCRQARSAGQGRRRALAGLRGDQLRARSGVRNELDFEDQFDAWSAKVNARQHRTTRARPIDRLAEELEVMTALPQVAPDTDRRWVLRVAPDPYVRFDGCDYSLDPDLVGRRVEIRIGDREVTATALDTGELACRHPRSFAPHRTITALEHARALKRRRGEAAPESVVQTRSLDVYDRLIA